MVKLSLFDLLKSSKIDFTIRGAVKLLKYSHCEISKVIIPNLAAQVCNEFIKQMKSNLYDDKSASLELCPNNGWDFDEVINHRHDAKEGKEVDKSSSGTLQGSYIHLHSLCAIHGGQDLTHIEWIKKLQFKKGAVSS